MQHMLFITETQLLVLGSGFNERLEVSRRWIEVRNEQTDKIINIIQVSFNVKLPRKLNRTPFTPVKYSV